MSDTFDELDRVLDEESWDFLNDNYPSLAITVQKEISKGRSPESIKRRVIERLGIHRVALAQRCELAAKHLERSK
jgi:hypothetical protein